MCNCSCDGDAVTRACTWLQLRVDRKAFRPTPVHIINEYLLDFFYNDFAKDGTVFNMNVAFAICLISDKRIMF